MDKVYLGDGAYAEFDGYAIRLTAEDGVRATDTVVLEPETWAALLTYVGHLALLGAPYATTVRK